MKLFILLACVLLTGATRQRRAGGQQNVIAGFILEDTKELITRVEEIKEGQDRCEAKVQEGQDRCEAKVEDVMNAQQRQMRALQEQNQQILTLLGSLTQKQDDQIVECVSQEVEEEGQTIDREVERVTPYSDCNDVYRSSPPGLASSGVYALTIGGQSVNASCDMTGGGGWTVIQRRQGSGSFNKNWAQYEEGFGDLGGDHWLGNKWVHLLTANKNYKLRIELVDKDGDEAYAEYSSFSLSSAGDKYRLRVGGYSGTAGDGMDGCSESHQNHNGHQFSTWDEDNDSYSGNCAYHSSSGWWFNDCLCANLNAGGSQKPTWSPWKDTWYSIRASTMKITPVS